MSAATEITVHLGVHRTGTTALQRLLQRHADRLAAAGIGYLGPATLRGEELAGDLRAWTKARAAGHAPVPSPLTAECGRLVAAGCTHVVISEENLPGTMGPNLSRAELYPNAEARLADLSAALPVAPARIFLTVRDYPGYWRSSHAHALLAGDDADFDASRFAGAAGNSWMPLLCAIRATFPDARVMVARHRADRSFVPALAAAMVGPGPLAGVARPWTTVNASLPADVLDTLRRMPRGPDRARMAEAARRAGGPPLDPFSAAQTAALMARFEREWAAIGTGAVPGVEILALAEPEAAR
ncbi:MAG: hypothetical protein F9K34_02930 [Albidovulum sp.]|uniref:hypothetical protein n=1 Tax=Albidovulum sp. TaxID=1872424 RepID=UPI0013294F6B|nr:hypothetical protein [Defluviimonas sp.]KAB2886216.1 MAG: hypothetical protein F9K34_02930 [Defluviimonas sp.]